MKPILKDLKDIKVKKHIVTSIEYDCKTEAAEDEVFDTVRNILGSGLDTFSKITFDVEPSKHTVKVEVSQNM